MDYRLAKRLGIQIVSLPQPVDAMALDGGLLSQVTHCTQLVRMSFPDHHTENLIFHLFHSPQYPLVLGFPWLKQHNPNLDWVTGQVIRWGYGCYTNCFSSKPVLGCTKIQKTQSIPESGSPAQEDLDLSQVPSRYHDLKEVFSKTRALSLPPHRPYDCGIELQPGSSPPRGGLYSLSGPELKAMKDYIDSSLASGIIRPSASAAGAGFFFVGKKDGSLRPCIDYRGLNNITIKNRYPLPLMSSAFELLQGAKVFTKLEP